MKILITSARIVDPQSRMNNQVCDVLIEDGTLKKISAKQNEKTDLVIDGSDCILTPGFFDLHATFGEPGFEFKEDLASGCNAAMAGGFTGVLNMPATSPVVQNSAAVELIRNKTKKFLVDVEVAGAVSTDLQGKELTEMFDMKKSGALCFTDHKKAVQDSGMMMRVLQYAKNFDGLIMSYPDDKSLSGKGQMNEGIVSTQLGLKGIPAIAEEQMIARDLLLCRYTGARIHFSTISAAGSVQLIRQAKKEKINVTCDVAAHHLLLTDDSLQEFDTRYKVKPPLRTASDVEALIAGLIDGTIDAICSDHLPEDVENKQKEFDLAAFGAEGLETAFSAAFTALDKKMSIEQIVEKFTSGPRISLGLPIAQLNEGEKANLTLFNTQTKWNVQESDLFSKSLNNPFIGMTLKGKVKAVFNNGQHKEF